MVRKVDNERESLWILKADTVLIVAEIIFAIVVYSLYRELGYLAFGHDSVGELISNLVTLFYVRGVMVDKHNHNHAGTSPHEHEFHSREGRASQYVAFVFFGLALSTLIWPLLGGVVETTHQVKWPGITVIIFTILTGILGVIKWRQSRGHDDPRWANALQSVLCVCSGVIAAIADWMDQWYQQSQVYGDVAIAILMFFAGCLIIHNKKLCC